MNLPILKNVTKLVSFFVVGVVVFTACTITTTDPTPVDPTTPTIIPTTPTMTPEEKAYTENLQKWQSKNIDDYDFVFQRICFCIAEVTRPARVSVQNSQKEQALWIENYQSVNPVFEDRYITIDEMFAVIKDAIDRDADKINVSYDDAYGFPTNVYIDFDPRIADEEISMKAHDFSEASNGVRALPITCEAYATDSYEYTVLAQSNAAAATLQVFQADGGVNVCVRSQHVNGCTHNVAVNSQRIESVFKLKTEVLNNPTLVACTQVFTPYARLVELDVGGLEPETYSIEYFDVNSNKALIPTTFELTTSN